MEVDISHCPEDNHNCEEENAYIKSTVEDKRDSTLKSYGWWDKGISKPDEAVLADVYDDDAKRCRIDDKKSQRCENSDGCEDPGLEKLIIDDEKATECRDKMVSGAKKSLAFVVKSTRQ